MELNEDENSDEPVLNDLGQLERSKSRISIEDNNEEVLYLCR
jgi:hypothetical protein